MTLRYSVADHIAEIVIDRPEAMNSIDPDTRALLKKAYADASADAEVRVVLFTGTGDRAFCTGADLKRTMPTGVSAAVEEFGTGSDHLLAGFPHAKPTICAVNGYALGGGLELALACDIRIASSTASFGLPEVRIGSIPGSSGTQLLPRTIGRGPAMQMILTGDRVDTDFALRVGLVNEVVEPGDLMTRARAVAARIAANAPLAVAAAKSLVAQAPDLPLVAGLALERYAFGLLRNTEDRVEGRTAFAEKRTPNYQGR
ncbi:3-hydroxybutyryl-CoA dehydratase [Acrocarpospora pleiomorpha]|uniref:enoyl-CoA hydratase n=1 Tax=Acrocarpospora pleiomorpha TaxID=90975 RepID=A0A5M3XQV8_9ACTN|nr:enoyl-CoA hydratase-related protein [Acrocarpospora pleiomorpha]GES20698.1 3-hydroxybutyryl-CoA dehydratase [Acrocarpospora pleiomorpha]